MTDDAARESAISAVIAILVKRGCPADVAIQHAPGIADAAIEVQELLMLTDVDEAELRKRGQACGRTLQELDHQNTSGATRH